MKCIEDVNTEYEKYLEDNNDTAPEAVRDAYTTLHESIDNYISTVSDFEWKCGFNHALRLIFGDGVK